MRIPKHFLPALLSLLAAACASASSGSSDDTANETGGSSGSSGTAGEAGSGGDMSPAPCAPVDAHAKGSCAMVLGYVWDGSACVGLSGCDCVGTECARINESLADCQEQFAACVDDHTECSSDVDCPKPDCLQCPDDSLACPTVQCVDNKCVSSPTSCHTQSEPCAPIDAMGSGSCKKELGYGWNGTICVSVTGCDCIGADCDKLTLSQSDCWKQNQACLAPVELCASVDDAWAVDQCATEWFLWNGKQCAPFTGCSCDGPGCLQLDDLETCQKKHASCTQGPCAPFEVAALNDDPDCETNLLGFFWNGTECDQLNGCKCTGKDCDKIYKYMGTCMTELKSCPSSTP